MMKLIFQPKTEREWTLNVRWPPKDGGVSQLCILHHRIKPGECRIKGQMHFVGPSWTWQPEEYLQRNVGYHHNKLDQDSTKT